MVSLYTDQAREQRYTELRKKTERCENLFAKCMLASIIVGLGESAGSLFSGPISYAISGGLVRLQSGIATCAAIASMVLSCIAIGKKSLWLMIAALTAVILTGAAGCYCMFCIGLIDIPVLFFSLFPAFAYEKLRQEEGFPRFRIDYEESEVRTAAQVRYVKKRALDSGVRVAQEALDPHAEMTDLLDADAHPEMLNAELSNYHNRFHGADAVVHAPELHDDSMDDLDDL